MAKNLAAVDNELIEEARPIEDHRTRKAAVAAARKEYMRNRNQRRILGLFGTIDYNKSYEYSVNAAARAFEQMAQRAAGL
jgi:hypothetical protein